MIPILTTVFRTENNCSRLPMIFTLCFNILCNVIFYADSNVLIFNAIRVLLDEIWIIVSTVTV
jgi:hypothetical protein